MSLQSESEEPEDYSTWTPERLLEELTDLFEFDFRGFTELEFGHHVECLDRRASFENFVAAMIQDGSRLASEYRKQHENEA